MSMNLLLKNTLLTILVAAVVLELLSVTGDLMSTPSDLAVLAGVLLAAITVWFGIKSVNYIWRKRE